MSKIESRSFEVSGKSPMFGGKSEMDKVVEKWTSEGWTLVNTTPIRGSKYLLRFERETKSKNQKASGNKGIGCLVLVLIFGGIYAFSSGRNENNTITTRTAIANAATFERSTNTRRATEETQYQIMLTARATDITWTPSSLPSNTPRPTNTVGSSNTPRRRNTTRPVTNTPEPTFTFSITPTLESYSISGTTNINVRSCPELTCEVIDQLSRGNNVSVIEVVSGATFNGNSTWLRIVHNNENAYIHSSLVNYPETNTSQSISSDEQEIVATPRNMISPTTNPQVEISLEQDNTDAITISDTLFILAGGRRVETVHVVNGRSNGGERSVIIGYIVTETTDIGFIDEMLDILDAVAVGIRAESLDLDSVQLVLGDAFGNALGIVGLYTDDLMDYHFGRISRSQFIDKLIVTSL